MRIKRPIKDVELDGREKVENSGDIIAVVAIVFSILSLCGWINIYLGLVTAIVAFVLGVIGINAENFPAFAKIAIILSIGGIIISILNYFIVGISF